jgi:Coenzyme PQQ synthesis protein D (PqqD)
LTISIESTVIAIDDQVSADLEGDAVVLALGRGEYYGLGGVGSRIWQLVREERRVSDIRDIILQEYEVDEPTCQRDLIRFLEQLESEGLIVVTHGSPH